MLNTHVSKVQVKCSKASLLRSWGLDPYHILKNVGVFLMLKNRTENKKLKYKNL